MSTNNLLAFAILVIKLSIIAAQESTVVVFVPELGEIQGNIAFTSTNQRSYWTFHGIPYADPASYIGPTKRFKPSEIKNTNLTEDGSIFKANKLQIICPQIGSTEPPADEILNLTAILTSISIAEGKIKNKLRENRDNNNVDEVPKPLGQEDCLTININTPKIPINPDEKLLPVILFIHGGGSTTLWGSAFTGLRIMERDVVLLTINYRMGVLGAFNLGIDAAPGCGAMYDAVTALKWIHRYVQYFGGDPNQVLIAGHSAGSMMVTHLLLSPLAKGLFHGVWGYSGAALSSWGVAQNPSLQHHLDVAYYADCFDRITIAIQDVDLEAVANCMANQPIDVLVHAVTLYQFQEKSIGMSGFDAVVPSLQSSTLTIPLFLSEEPVEILKEGRQHNVPLVLGSTSHDGSYALLQTYNDYLLPSGKVYNKSYVQNELIPELMKNAFGVADESMAMYHSLSRLFLGGAANTDDFESKIPGLIDISTALVYKAGMYKMLEYHSKIQSKSYFYNLNYKGRWTVYYLFGGIPEIPGGITHFDDMLYVFNFAPLFNEDRRVSRHMVDYLVNFATFGDPNGVAKNMADVFWPPHDSQVHPCLNIDRVVKVNYQCPSTWIGASANLVNNDDSKTLDSRIYTVGKK